MTYLKAMKMVIPLALKVVLICLITLSFADESERNVSLPPSAYPLSYRVGAWLRDSDQSPWWWATPRRKEPSHTQQMSSGHNLRTAHTIPSPQTRGEVQWIEMAFSNDRGEPTAENHQLSEETLYQESKAPNSTEEHSHEEKVYRKKSQCIQKDNHFVQKKKGITSVNKKTFFTYYKWKIKL